jgi:hypothetical protein
MSIPWSNYCTQCIDGPPLRGGGSPVWAGSALGGGTERFLASESGGGEERRAEKRLHRWPFFATMSSAEAGGHAGGTAVDGDRLVEGLAVAAGSWLAGLDGPTWRG